MREGGCESGGGGGRGRRRGSANIEKCYLCALRYASRSESRRGDASNQSSISNGNVKRSILRPHPPHETSSPPRNFFDGAAAACRCTLAARISLFSLPGYQASGAVRASSDFDVTCSSVPTLPRAEVRCPASAKQANETTIGPAGAREIARWPNNTLRGKSFEKKWTQGRGRGQGQGQGLGPLIAAWLRGDETKEEEEEG